MIFLGGGLGTGGLNFDAKLRRQSIDPEDLFHGHIGGMDVCARGLISAAKMIEDGKLKTAVDARYAGWDSELGRKDMEGAVCLTDLSDWVLDKGLDPQPRSGRQEALENLVNRYN